MIAMELSWCPCVVTVESAAAGITSHDGRVAMVVVGSVSVGFASTDDDFGSKSFRFILVENTDFPHQSIFFFVCFVFVLFCVFGFCGFIFVYCLWSGFALQSMAFDQNINNERTNRTKRRKKFKTI